MGEEVYKPKEQIKRNLETHCLKKDNSSVDFGEKPKERDGNTKMLG